jgi:cytochrome bd-type quinol oxidase subunit 2
MIKKIKEVLIALVVSGAFLVPVAVPVMVSAQAGTSPQIQDGLCSGAELQFDTTATGCQSSAGASTKLNDLIKTIINIVSIVVGVVAVIMIVFGGLRYITSGGESSNVSSAKNTIIYAIVGLVVVALAQFIVRFVLDKSINGSAGTP